MVVETLGRIESDVPTNGTAYTNVPIDHTGSARVSYNSFPPQTWIPVHVHPQHEQVVVCVAGSIEVSIEGSGATWLKPGDCITIPRGEEHWFVSGSAGAISVSILAGEFPVHPLTTLPHRIRAVFENDSSKLLASGVLTNPAEHAARSGLSGHDARTVEWVSNNLLSEIGSAWRRLSDDNPI